MLNVSGVIDPPAEGRAGRSDARVGFRHPGAQSAERIEGYPPAWEMVGQPVEEGLHVVLRQVHHQPLGDDHHRAIPRYLVQKVGIGH